MTYKVSFSTDYNYSVKTSQPVNYKTNLFSKIEIMPQNLNELSDVQISGNNDKYLLMYDAASGKWKDVNPDSVLSAATTEPISPGLPADFENQLDVDLDNKIDLDAGTF
jgi:hypothetical protein